MRKPLVVIDRNLQDVIIADLQKQILELNLHLEVQDLEDHMNDHDSDSSFHNQYHNGALFWEFSFREGQHEDLGFRVDLLDFSGYLQVESFIDFFA